MSTDSEVGRQYADLDELCEAIVAGEDELKLNVSVSEFFGSTQVSVGPAGGCIAAQSVIDMDELFEALRERVDLRRRGQVGTVTVKRDGWTFNEVVA